MTYTAEDKQFWKKLAMRDGAICAFFALLWVFLSQQSAGHGPWPDFIGVVTGVGLGIIAYIAHEWGHILGGWLGKSKMSAGRDMQSFSNFVYDSRANNRWQFLLMSFSGFAMTGIAVYVYFVYLPHGLLATQVAHGSILFLVLLGLVLELPLVIWSLVSPKLPPIDKGKRPAADSQSV